MVRLVNPAGVPEAPKRDPRADIEFTRVVHPEIVVAATIINTARMRSLVKERKRDEFNVRTFSSVF